METIRTTPIRTSCAERRGSGRRPSFSSLRIVLYAAILFLILGRGESLAQGVGISETSITPDTWSILELRSTLRGFLAPRMTTAERTTLGSKPPAQGMLVYDTNVKSFFYYDGAWIAIPGGTSILGVANGGTGLSSITANNLLYGAGTSAASLLATGATTGAVLMNTASGAPSWSLLGALPSTAGVLLVANGGTGLSSITANNLLYGNGTGAASLLAPGATTGALLMNTASGAPSWSLLSALPSTAGALPATNGGTGVANNAASTLTISGNYATTLTITGITGVTLPTSGTLATIGVLIAVQVFTADGTYTPTGNIKSFVVYAIGGGGGGGGCPNTNGATGAGGGAGGTAIAVYTNPLGSYSYTIGALGAGVSNANGGTGGNTTFDVLTANGGVGGTVGNATTFQPRAGGTGGTATGGNMNLQGMTGGAGVRLAATAGYGLAGTGGSTLFGSGGPGCATGVAGNGSAGTGYGSGGGGSIGNTARAGGNGTAGVVIVFEYK